MGVKLTLPQEKITFKNLGLKLHEVASITKESQIESEKQLEELASPGDHISKKFGEYEEERKKEKEQIECLQERVSLFEKKS